jgi:hypothetical protein
MVLCAPELLLLVLGIIIATENDLSATQSTDKWLSRENG